VPDTVLSEARRYEEALACFYQRRWDDCMDTLGALQTHGPGRHLASLARAFRQQEPPPDWQGEYTRETKQ
jgi:hypothetical protein